MMTRWDVLLIFTSTALNSSFCYDASVLLSWIPLIHCKINRSFRLVSTLAMELVLKVQPICWLIFVFRGWNFGLDSTCMTLATIFGYIIIAPKLSCSLSIWSWGNNIIWILIWVLTILRWILIHGVWTNDTFLLNKHPSHTVVGWIIFLSYNSWIHLVSSPWVYSLSFYHIFKHSVIILNNCTMLVLILELLIMHHSTQIGIIFRCYNLSLHSSCYRQIPMVSDLSIILNTIWSYTTNSTMWKHIVEPTVIWSDHQFPIK